MSLTWTLLAAVALLGTNFFFVLAEFAIVRVRAARVEALVELGVAGSRSLRHIQQRMEEYLSVVQIGITGATIGMGVIIDDGLARAIHGMIASDSAAARTAGTVASFIIATYLTIVSAELVPKALALRYTERAALIAARPMRVFHVLFYPLLMVLAKSARAVLYLLGMSKTTDDAPHSEDELRIIMGQSQEGGVMTFRRLLLFENVFDLADLKVKDAMRPRHRVVTLGTDMDRAAITKLVAKEHFSRYPVVRAGDSAEQKPVGVVHVKDVLVQDDPLNLERLARPFPTFTQDTALEQALGTFQRSRNHLAIVTNTQGQWTGILTFEDVIEELIGQIEDEFERDDPLHLDHLINDQAIALDVAGSDIERAIGAAFQRLSLSGLPPGHTTASIAGRLLEREHALTSYVGKGIAVPHLRVDGLQKPVLAFARLATPAPVPGRHETAHLLFIVLTPSGAARVHLRIMARIAQIADSDFLLERLHQATTPAEVIEAIAAGDRLTTG
jgi:CBS domain containing-hemolysin-like protein